MSDAPDPKQYWGYLFRPDKTPSELLEDLLIGLATYINEKVGPDDVHCLVPSKLSAFYHAVGGDYDSFFLDTVHPSLSFIYQSLGCVHTLQPTSDDFAPPTIPALEPRGFARWQCIQLLLGPEEHVPYLQEAVRKYDIVNSSTKKVFPKVLPREAFPDKPDEDMTKWHDDVFDRLKSEAQDEQGGSQRSESGFQDYPSSVPQHDIYGDRSGAREAPGDYFSSGHENSRKFAPRGRNPPQAPHPNHPDWMRGRDIRGGFRNVQKPRKQSFPDQHYMQDPRFADVRVPPRREDVSPGSRPRSPTNVSSASSITSSSTDRNAGDDDDDDFDDRSSSLPRSDNSSSPAANRYYPLVDPPTPLHHRHQGQSHLNVPSSSPSAYPHHRRRHSDVSISPSTAPSSSPASHYAYDLSGPPSFSRPTTAQSFIQPEPFSPHRSPHTLSPSRSPYVSGPSRGNSRGLNVRWTNENSFQSFGGSAPNTPGSEGRHPSPSGRGSRRSPERDRVRHRHHDRDQDRERDRSRDHRDRSRGHDRDRSRDRDRDRDRDDHRHRKQRYSTATTTPPATAKTGTIPQIRRPVNPPTGVDGRRYPAEGVMWQ